MPTSGPWVDARPKSLVLARCDQCGFSISITAQPLAGVHPRDTGSKLIPYKRSRERHPALALPFVYLV